MKQILLIILLAFSLSASAQVQEHVDAKLEKPCPSKRSMLTVYAINHLYGSMYTAFAINWVAYGDCWIAVFTDVVVANPDDDFDEVLLKISIEAELVLTEIE